MKKKGFLGWLAFALLIIGGLNWGLVGLFNFDVVAAIFGAMSTVTKIIYVLVGLAALYKLFFCKHCCKDMPENKPM
ncbi:MAG: hypothetical protein A2927_02095 [Candidatus Komeilibacteria bacterium RIFCSPLOWO2_01_FULL_45_10]|uniref:DUF378 domain-containing protein n=1 Tax=Candidatus Komeilibacteria bacterium RIFCSPLOWO2_01_FULL_45_10 TaxID=1798550 RepID=A0A1G2BJG7_9BACT|nr:MAG: hypothetical protein A2927_02095 [Candidatus Komeilibacteria bacterium RIFCSPLOWO2_01_FULL_45_10]